MGADACERVQREPIFFRTAAGASAHASDSLDQHEIALFLRLNVSIPFRAGASPESCVSLRQPRSAPPGLNSNPMCDVLSSRASGSALASPRVYASSGERADFALGTAQARAPRSCLYHPVLCLKLRQPRPFPPNSGARQITANRSNEISRTRRVRSGVRRRFDRKQRIGRAEWLGFGGRARRALEAEHRHGERRRLGRPPGH